jgi:hypothetical protein
MPIDKFIVVWLPIALGIVMIGAGAVNFVAPGSVRDSFARWGYPAGFHRVTGGLELIAGTAADPSYVACRRDRQRRNPSGRGDNADPPSRLEARARRHRADGSGGGGNDSGIDEAAVAEAFGSRGNGVMVTSARPWNYGLDADID